jgi:integrase
MPNATIGFGLERKVARRALDRAVKAAQLKAPKPTLHDLRHSHASMLIVQGYNLVEIQRRLGHRKPDTTLKVYAHEWKYRQAQRSQIGAQLGLLLSADGAPELPESVEGRVVTGVEERLG